MDRSLGPKLLMPQIDELRRWETEQSLFSVFFFVYLLTDAKDTLSLKCTLALKNEYADIIIINQVLLSETFF